MEGLLSGTVTFGLLFWIIILVLAIFMPVFVFEAQRYAHNCYTELKKINSKLDLLVKEKSRGGF